MPFRSAIFAITAAALLGTLVAAARSSHSQTGPTHPNEPEVHMSAAPDTPVTEPLGDPVMPPIDAEPAPEADEPVSAPPSVALPALSQPVGLGSLRSRHFTVHFHAGNHYSVENENGELIGVHLTEEEFAESFSGIHGETRGMIASPLIADSLRPR